MTVPDSALPLLASAPARFAAARSALAQALAGREAREAASVRKLRRPLGLSWVMNRLARDHAAELEGLLEAADRLREGQRRAVAGEGADALRAAGDAVRERSRALRERGAAVLAEEGLRPEPVKLARLELLLRAAASSHREVRDALRRGALLREPEVSGELSGLALVPGGADAGGPRAARAAGAGAREGGKARRHEGAREGVKARHEDARDGAKARRHDDAREGAKAQRQEERERRALELKRSRAVARAEKDERAARKAEAAARRAAEVARGAAERAAALRARADRARAEAEFTPRERSAPGPRRGRGARRTRRADGRGPSRARTSRSPPWGRRRGPRGPR
jgi:hypothetical protein